MKPRPISRAKRPPRIALSLGWLLLSSLSACAGGVTIITHGLNGDTDGWVSGMAGRIPSYERFVGTNHSSYHVYFFPSGG